MYARSILFNLNPNPNLKNLGKEIPYPNFKNLRKEKKSFPEINCLCNPKRTLSVVLKYGGWSF